MPYTKETLQNVYSLTPEEVDATLTACGLTLEQEEYSDSDIESKFDKVRDYFQSQQVTDYEQAAQKLQTQISSTTSESSQQDISASPASQTKQSDLKNDIGTITQASETELANLVDKITDKLAERIPPGFIQQVYVQKAVAKLAQSPEEIHEFFVELEQGIMQQLEGKSPMELMLERGRTSLLPRSSLKSVELLPESESDTTTS
jgi:hypothetical protein